MSLATLIATLSAEADAESAAELARARAEAGAITAASTERVEARRAQARNALEQERESAVQRALIESRRSARRIVLDARADLVAAVFAAARQRFPEALESAAYRASLPATLTEALAALGERPARLRAHPLIASSLSKSTAAEVVEDAGAGAGFRAATEDGSLEVDCTLEARLRALTPVLSLEILKQVEATP